MIPQLMPVVEAPCVICGAGLSHHALQLGDVSGRIPAGTIIHLCNRCFVGPCESDDVKAAEMFVVMQEAYSAGATDAGFVEQLQKDGRSLGVELYLGIESHEGEDPTPYFVACTMVPSAMSYLFCRSKSPIPDRIAHEAVKLLPLVKITQWPCYERWSLGQLSERGHPCKMEQKPWLIKGIVDMCASNSPQGFGTADLFLLWTYAETTAGYELIRRRILYPEL